MHTDFSEQENLVLKFDMRHGYTLCVAEMTQSCAMCMHSAYVAKYKKKVFTLTHTDTDTHAHPHLHRTARERIRFCSFLKKIQEAEEVHVVKKRNQLIKVQYEKCGNNVKVKIVVVAVNFIQVVRQ